MWADGVMSGLDALFPVERNGEPDVIQIMNDWRKDIQKLMSWLDWSVWIKCRPACGPEVGSKRSL
jgi:isopentenyl diphosphate isomerase/L-lactate dehydrogenase-like FMN-dependent dehydrogenase